MKLFTGLICLVFIAIVHSASASEPEAAGRVKTASGSVSVIRGGQSYLLKPGDKIFENDQLKTGSAGALGVVLRDNTSFSLGHNSKLTIDEYVFVPAKNKFSLITKMTRGVVAFISGKISKLSPESVRFETPLATIAIRGTKFLVMVDEN